MRDALKNISSQELLDAVAEKEGVLEPDRPHLRKEVMQAFRRAKTKSLKSADAGRPKWLTRPAAFEALSSPMFLRTVYADLLDSNGAITDEDRIRRHDPKLVQVVLQYIAKRSERGQGPGDATGLSFTNKGWRGPSRKRQVKTLGMVGLHLSL